MLSTPSYFPFLEGNISYQISSPFPAVALCNIFIRRNVCLLFYSIFEMLADNFFYWQPQYGSFFRSLPRPLPIAVAGAAPLQKKEVVKEEVDEKDKVGFWSDYLKFGFEIKTN